jgi:hypothetical protein
MSRKTNYKTERLNPGGTAPMNEGVNALQVSQRRGPATDVVFNPVTGRLELVRPAVKTCR